MAEERERYFYLFLHVGSSTESINHLLRLLLPHSLLRRRLLRRAKTDLAQEFDKHAGRARWDISQRLDAVRRRFETAMASELAGSVETILAAASRAEQLRGVAEAERQVQRQANEVRQQGSRSGTNAGGRAMTAAPENFEGVRRGEQEGFAAPLPATSALERITVLLRHMDTELAAVRQEVSAVHRLSVREEVPDLDGVLAESRGCSLPRPTPLGSSRQCSMADGPCAEHLIFSGLTSSICRLKISINPGEWKTSPTIGRSCIANSCPP